MGTTNDTTFQFKEGIVTEKLTDHSGGGRGLTGGGVKAVRRFCGSRCEGKPVDSTTPRNQSTGGERPSPRITGW